MSTLSLLPFGVPGPVELLIIAVIVILLFGGRFPRVVYWVGQEIAAVQHQIDQPENTRWRAAVFFSLLLLVVGLALMLVIGR